MGAPAVIQRHASSEDRQASKDLKAEQVAQAEIAKARAEEVQEQVRSEGMSDEDRRKRLLEGIDDV